MTATNPVHEWHAMCVGLSANIITNNINKHKLCT